MVFINFDIDLLYYIFESVGKLGTYLLVDR